MARCKVAVDASLSTHTVDDGQAVAHDVKELGADA
jgi:hypothetical protein